MPLLFMSLWFIFVFSHWSIVVASFAFLASLLILMNSHSPKVILIHWLCTFCSFHKSEVSLNQIDYYIWCPDVLQPLNFPYSAWCLNQLCSQEACRSLCNFQFSFRVLSEDDIVAGIFTRNLARNLIVGVLALIFGNFVG